MQASFHQLQPDRGRGAGVHDQVLHVQDPGREEHPRVAADQGRCVKAKDGTGSRCDFFKAGQRGQSVSWEKAEEQRGRLLRNLHHRGGNGGQVVLVEQPHWQGRRNCAAVDCDRAADGHNLHVRPDCEHQPEHPAAHNCDRSDHHSNHPVPEGPLHPHWVDHRYLADNYNDAAT